MLTAFQMSTLVGLTASLALGLTVFLINPSRRTNAYFLLVSLSIVVWMACTSFAAFTRDTRWLLFWIRQVSMSAALIPVTFDLLRMAITHDGGPFRLRLREVLPWMVLLGLAAVSCQLPVFVLDVQFGETGFGRPVYGWGHYLFVAFWVLALALLGRRYARDLKRAAGVRYVELQFVLLGFAAGASFALVLSQGVPMVTGSRDIMQFTPLAVVPFVAIVAYGIVTRRILSVGYVMRRAAAYGLLVLYMTLVYAGVSLAAAALARALSLTWGPLAPFCGALAMALAVAPAHGWMQRVADALLISRGRMDVQDTIRRAQEVVGSLGTTHDLVDRLVRVLRTGTGADHVSVFLRQGEAFDKVSSLTWEAVPSTLAGDDVLFLAMRDVGQPLAVDALRRLRAGGLTEKARRRLAELDASVAVAIGPRERPAGLLLLGPRLTGRIYSAEEQDAVQVICDQFRIALENAQLYTDVQNSQRYNETLLDSLVSGVVATDNNRVVTVINQEAQRITGLRAEDVVGRRIEVLPAALVEMVLTTLGHGFGEDDRNADIERAGTDPLPVRAGSAVIRGHADNAVMGCLIVFSDMSLVRRLEAQVRRTDRLSSLGTLAAGMAHEIKNPLVSIKTFAQLLPDRYEDQEFRESFSALIGQEIERIDSIVNRLLHFSRPARPQLTDVSLHSVIEESLTLIKQQLTRRGLVLIKTLKAPRDRISGDVNLLQQALINFFLNAIESMEAGGELTVATTCRRARQDGVAAASVPERLCLSIQDTGCGIPAEDVGRVFDPFFTTKTRGTGLGLSVAHGIIQEHGASIDIKSRAPGGTTFLLLFPMVAVSEACP